MVKTKIPAGKKRKEHIKMTATHYQVQISGWSKPRYFTSSEGRMFFHVGGCPANALCETCKERIRFVKNRFRYYRIPFRESVTPSGFLCFGFDGPVGTPIPLADPVEFLQVFLEAPIEVLRKWETEEE